MSISSAENAPRGTAAAARPTSGLRARERSYEGPKGANLRQLAAAEQRMRLEAAGW